MFGKSVYVLPRNMIARLQRLVTVKIMIDVVLRPIAPTMAMVPFDDQRRIVQHLITTYFTAERIVGGRGYALLNLGAGRGKTMVAALLIQQLGVRTIFVVTKSALESQAANDLRAGLANCTICEYSEYKKLAKSKRKVAQLPDILVIIINSICSMKNRQILSHYDMIIYDEIHEYATESRRAVFRAATLPIVLGMSATTDEREDGLDETYKREFGRVYYADSNSNDNDTIPPQFKCNVEIIDYYAPNEFGRNLSHETTNELFCHYMYAQFMSDPYRVELARRKIVLLYQCGHTSYCFAEELEHLNIMREALIKCGLVAPKDIARLVGGLDVEELDHIRGGARVILCTYGYAGTGISILHASAIVFLTPRKAKMKQILARILRRGSDANVVREVYDICDTRTCLKYQVDKRIIGYSFYQMNIVRRRCHYSSIDIGAAPTSTTESANFSYENDGENSEIIQVRPLDEIDEEDIGLDDV